MRWRFRQIYNGNLSHKIEIILCDDTTELYQQLLQSALVRLGAGHQIYIDEEGKRVIEGAFSKDYGFP